MRPCLPPLPPSWPAALAGLLLLAGCASPAPPSPAGPVRPAPPPAPAAPPPLPVVGGDAKFQAFIQDFEATVLANGVSAQTYNQAVAGLAPIPGIAQMNADQPEFAKQVWSYLDSAVSARRIADAKYMQAQYPAMLSDIETKSGVPKEILVAIWGMETDYGHDTGGFNLFAALATLAYDGPRQDYARPEFLAALKMLQQQNYPMSEMVASWAGAFGQTQFTPTAFFKYAVDGDGDGHIDLWRSPADALASSASLLKQSGWATGKGWGMEVMLPHNFAYEDADLDIAKPLSEWTARGVTLPSGAPLPTGDDAAAIYLPAGARGPAFLTFANFKVILKYNNAASYALAVALLSDRMAGRPAIVASWPRDERALSRTERIQFQTDLKTLGFDPGAPDGVLGRGSRAALRQYQKARGLAADGFPTAGLLTKLDAEPK
jgi:membrane-bound lytic murein transglycosylase B